MVNKIVDGKQMTIAWLIDGLTVSHHNPLKVDALTDLLESICVEITIKYGQVNNHLRMMLDYKEKGKLKVSIVEYMDKVLWDSPEEIHRMASMPAVNYLF